MINVQFFDDLHVSDITVISGERLFGRTVDHEGSGRKTCGFLYVWRGEVTFFVSGKEKIVVSSEELAYIPRHLKYKMRYTAETTVFVVVNFNLYGQGEEINLYDSITPLLKDGKTNQIAGIMTSFELCGNSKTVSAAFRKKELIYRLFNVIYAINHALSDDGVDLRIRAGVSLLEQSYLENLPIDRFADESHVSVNTFRTLFHKQFGISPVKYRNTLRIERAKELLQDGSLTVAEVAYASGFESVGYFCRYYRKVTGVSPGETKQEYNNEKSRH